MEKKFQSTPPARGATAQHLVQLRFLPISIHAPREGGDVCPSRCANNIFHNFNPRPPRGGRPRSLYNIVWEVVFQSTPPARGATLAVCHGTFGRLISIHAPREGGDC